MCQSWLAVDKVIAIIINSLHYKFTFSGIFRALKIHLKNSLSARVVIRTEFHTSETVLNT